AFTIFTCNKCGHNSASTTDTLSHKIDTTKIEIKDSSNWHKPKSDSSTWHTPTMVNGKAPLIIDGGEDHTSWGAIYLTPNDFGINTKPLVINDGPTDETMPNGISRWRVIRLPDSSHLVIGGDDGIDHVPTYFS